MTFHREQETYDRQRQPMLDVGDLFRRLRCLNSRKTLHSLHVRMDADRWGAAMIFDNLANQSRLSIHHVEVASFPALKLNSDMFSSETQL
jgi:hypothetical protein